MDNFLGLNIEFWFAFCLITLAYFVNNIFRSKRKKLPPGPFGLPIVGYLPLLIKNANVEISKLAKKYGEIFSVRIGSKLVVILNGSDSIKEAFTKSELLARPPNIGQLILAKDTPYAGTDIEKWQEQRRFVVQALKDHGLGRLKIEGQIQEEVQHFIKELKTYQGKPMDIMELLNPSIANNLGTLVFGERHDYDHPERRAFDERINEVRKIVAQSAIYIFFPWIHHIPIVKNRFDIKHAFKIAAESDNLFRNKVEEHKATFDPIDIRDFIDSYLIEMKTKMEKDSNTSFNDSALIANIANFFLVGSESVAVTVSWNAYIIAAFPEVQKKVQKEIMEVLGPNREPDLQDKKSLPYTNAVLLELARWKTVAPMNVMRYTTDDITVGGYHIPKDTVVIGNFWGAHFDPKYWKDPFSFIPERFLSEDKKSVIKSPHFMPFSVGKRACPGEAMANMEVFHYFVSLMQKFTIEIPQENEKPILDTELFLTYRLRPHKLRFIPKL